MQQRQFKLVFISKIEWNASTSEESPQEQVTFEYGGLQIQYALQTPGGAPGPVETGGWNITTNEPS